jgi:A/G-specific adenine glycosylase
MVVKHILNKEKITAFQELVMMWWCENKRDLPWRENPTSYNVLVSEIMLQQTQVSRVIPKFELFLREFPDLESLANANQKHLLKTWSGLGYNRRALWLREAAQDILNAGEFPKSVDKLRKLKGIGPYTSRSILIFAFNIDIAAVDTNIRRVFISSGFATEDMTNSELQKIADELLLKGRSSDWHNALMDYGAMELTASSTGIAPLTTQSCFEGSTRQIRGAIVRIMIDNEIMKLTQLSKHSEFADCDGKTIEKVLDQLVQERLLEQVDQETYRIP